MARIVASITIDNISDPSKSLRCDALVDAGASHLVLPSAWKERLGDLQAIRTVELETATQATVHGEVYGPVKIRLARVSDPATKSDRWSQGCWKSMH